MVIFRINGLNIPIFSLMEEKSYGRENYSISKKELLYPNKMSLRKLSEKSKGDTHEEGFVIMEMGTSV